MDGEVSNSTFAEEFAKAYPDRYFEIFIAEQQLVATAVGMSVRHYIPFASTFAAFFSIRPKSARAGDRFREGLHVLPSSRPVFGLGGGHTHQASEGIPGPLLSHNVEFRQRNIVSPTADSSHTPRIPRRTEWPRS